jgi:peptide/nickel transport system substrate-binding protein
MGCVANYPQVIVSKTDLKNVPDRRNLAQNGIVNPGKIPCPASYDPECYFWDNPAQHNS